MSAYPVAAQRDVPLGSLTRPVWRGRLHVFALCAAVPVFVALLAVVSSTRHTGRVNDPRGTSRWAATG